MRSFLLSLAIGAVFIGPVLADPSVPAAAPASDPMAGYYGNTAISTGGMAEVHIQYNVDHTFVMNVPAFSLRFKGTWALNGSTLCFNYDVPPPGVTNPDCGPVVAHKVGDTWTENADDGQRKLTLVAGVQ